MNGIGAHYYTNFRRNSWTEFYPPPHQLCVSSITASNLQMEDSHTASTRYYNRVACLQDFNNLGNTKQDVDPQKNPKFKKNSHGMAVFDMKRIFRGYT